MENYDRHKAEGFVFNDRPREENVSFDLSVLMYQTPDYLHHSSGKHVNTMSTQILKDSFDTLNLCFRRGFSFSSLEIS